MMKCNIIFGNQFSGKRQVSVDFRELIFYVKTDDGDRARVAIPCTIMSDPATKNVWDTTPAEYAFVLPMETKAIRLNIQQELDKFPKPFQHPILLK